MKHLAIILALLAIIPLSNAALTPQAQQAGYHDTLYTNTIQTANTTTTRLTIAQNTNVIGELTASQQLKLGSGPSSAIGNSFVSHIYQTRGDGINYPFNAYGHLALQPRTATTRDIVFLTRQGSSAEPRMVIQGTGRVGIGTTNPDPTKQLHVVGDLLVEGSICDDDGNCVGSGGASSLWSQDGPSNIYYQSGFVGIGTSTPDTRLHVTGTTYLDGDVGIGTNTPSATLEVDGTALITSDSQVQGNQIVDGNLGVGTSSPSTKLEVDGSATITNQLQATDIVATNEIETNTIKSQLQSGKQATVGLSIEETSSACVWDSGIGRCMDGGSAPQPTCPSNSFSGETERTYVSTCSIIFNQFDCERNDYEQAKRACLTLTVS